MCEHECNLTLYQQGTEKKTYNMSTTQKLTVGWINVSKLYWVQSKNSHSVHFSVTNSMRKQQLKMSLIIDVKIKKYNKRGNVENKNVLHEGGVGHRK